MSIHFDDKGKFFTEIVTKNPVTVMMQTLKHRIHGQIFVRPGERLKDELDQSSQFVAVTNAVVYGESGEELSHADFMVVNIDQIVWLIPEQDSTQDPDREGAAQ
jgi:hypothetical protein